VLDGDPLTSQKRVRNPPPQKKSAHVYCGQTAGWIKIVLGTGVGLSPCDLVVLDGEPRASPLPKRGQSPLLNFWPISNVAEMAECTKVPLGTELGLSPGDIALDGDQPPPQ